jgi:hypothetical protein
MRSLLLIAMFGLVLLGGQETLLHNLAFARHTATHCCMCGSCYSYCWCSGQASCKCYAKEEWPNITLASAYDFAVDIRRPTLYGQSHVMVVDSENLINTVRAELWQASLSITLVNRVSEYLRFRCANSI